MSVSRGQLAKTFLRIGATSYGGPAIVAQIREADGASEALAHGRRVSRVARVRPDAPRADRGRDRRAHRLAPSRRHRDVRRHGFVHRTGISAHARSFGGLLPLRGDAVGGDRLPRPGCRGGRNCGAIHRLDGATGAAELAGSGDRGCSRCRFLRRSRQPPGAAGRRHRRCAGGVGLAHCPGTGGRADPFGRTLAAATAGPCSPRPRWHWRSSLSCRLPASSRPGSRSSVS